MAVDPHQSGLIPRPADVVETLIRERRSIRKYKSAPLPQEWIDAMLQCAHLAPSPSNSQPVRYVRIDTPDCRNTLRQAFTNGHSRFIAKHKAAGGSARLRNWINAYKRFAEFMYEAPVLLAVGVTTQRLGFAGRLAEAGLLDRDMRQSTDLDITVGLALSGLMLKAQALGVGSCVLTAPLVFIDAPEQLLGLDEIKIKCFVTLGLADEAPSPTSRKPLKEMVRVI
jgi:nitroreductase